MANRQTWHRFHPPVTQCLNTFALKQTDGKHENAINPWIIWCYWILATLFMKETSRSASFMLTDKSLFMNNLIFLNISNHIRERSLQLCIIYGDWQEPVYGHDYLHHTSRYWRWWCLPEHQGGQIMIRCSVVREPRMWHKELHCNTLSPNNIIYSSIKNS